MQKSYKEERREKDKKDANIEEVEGGADRGGGGNKIWENYGGRNNIRKKAILVLDPDADPKYERRFL